MLVRQIMLVQIFEQKLLQRAPQGAEVDNWGDAI
jgi:hypothetical protein